MGRVPPRWAAPQFSGVLPGGVWASKRKGEEHRLLYIFEVDGDRVFVRRNTSRRKQAVSLKTLFKDYRFVRVEGDRE